MEIPRRRVLYFILIGATLAVAGFFIWLGSGNILLHHITGVGNILPATATVHASPAPLHWTESAGLGAIAPACASSSGGICFGASPGVTISWTDGMAGINSTSIWVCPLSSGCSDALNWFRVAAFLPPQGSFDWVAPNPRLNPSFNTTYAIFVFEDSAVAEIMIGEQLSFHGSGQDIVTTPASCCAANMGQSCSAVANACGRSDSGTIQCNGTCSVSSTPNPAGYGNACTSSANACGVTNSGTQTCSGGSDTLSCSASAPANPGGYGNACNPANVCGATNSGSLTCGGGSNTLFCSVSAPANPSPAITTGCTSAANACGMTSPGTYVCSGGGLASSCNAVTPSNLLCPPTVNAGLGHTVFVGTSHAHGGASASQPGGGSPSCSWSWVSTPSGAPGLSGQSCTGVTYTPNALGNYTLRLTATNGVTSASADVTDITQNRPPVLNAIGNKTVNEGVNLSFTVTATDPDGTTPTLSLTRTGGLPLGTSFNAATGVFTWTPSFTQSGTYTGFVFSAPDGSLTTSETIQITVNNVFNYSLSMPDVSVRRGQSQAVNATITLLAGAPEDIFITNITGLPIAGVSVSYNPASRVCQPNSTCTIQLTFSADNTASVASNSLVVNATNLGPSAPLNISNPFTLNILNAPLVLNSCSVSNPTPKAGEQVNWNATVSGGNGVYTYDWSGSGHPEINGRTGNPLPTTYLTTGSRTGRVQVRSGDGQDTGVQFCDTVNVQEGIIEFTATPQVLNPGEATELHWNTDGFDANECTMTQTSGTNKGTVPAKCNPPNCPDTKDTDIPLVTTTYTLQCTNTANGHTDQKTATVEVRPPPNIHERPPR